MRMNRLGRAAQIIVGCLCIGVVSLAPELEAREGCQRFSPPEEFPYSFSFVRQQDEVIVAAYLEGGLWRYDLTGRKIGVIDSGSSGRSPFSQPGLLRPTEKGFIVQNVLWHWIWTDEDFVPLRDVRFEQRSADPDLMPPLVQLATTDFWPWEGDILAFGFARREGEESAHRHFMKLKIVEGKVKLDRIIESVDAYAPMSRFYSETHPILARTRHGVYGLKFGEPHAILRLDAEGELTAFPREYARTSILPEAPGSPAGSAMLATALEKMTVPRALFGRDDHLYLLARKPRPRGGTLWELIQIDPEKDRVVRTLLLPTRAPHLRLIPGPERWVLLEQGSREPKAHPLEGWVTVPSAWIEDPESDVLTGDETVTCSTS